MGEYSLNSLNSECTHNALSGALWQGEGDVGERDEGEGGEEGHRLGEGQAGQIPAEALKNELKTSKKQPPCAEKI